MDSNHDKSLQRALCYRYTTGQTGGVKLSLSRARAKEKFTTEPQTVFTAVLTSELPRSRSFPSTIDELYLSTWSRWHLIELR